MNKLHSMPDPTNHPAPSGPSCGHAATGGCGHSHPAPAQSPIHDHGHGHEHRDGVEVCHHGPLGEHHLGRDVICVDHVTFGYGGPPVLKDVTLHIEQGCNLGIVGPNGGGKTTLLRLILGLLTGYSGKIEVMGLSPAKACRRGDLVGYVPQRHEFETRFPVTVRQVVRMGLVGKTGILKGYRPEDLDRVEELIQRVGLKDKAQAAIGELSGGQQQRALIARALAAGPRILLLDEPMSGLDPAGQQEIAGLIRQLHESLGLTVVVVSHDLRSVAAGCGKVACLNQTVHYHDSPEGLTPRVLQEVFSHDVAAVFQTGRES